jgi:hypothetical protein
VVLGEYREIRKVALGRGFQIEKSIKLNRMREPGTLVRSEVDEFSTQEGESDETYGCGGVAFLDGLLPSRASSGWPRAGAVLKAEGRMFRLLQDMT